MTTFEIASLAIAGVAAGSVATAAAGIWYGICAMVRANQDRAAILDQQRVADDQRHAESMAALNAQAQALRGQSDALAELIRRTGGTR